jgi:transcriptional regulator with XRE-family HTH domain
MKIDDQLADQAVLDELGRRIARTRLERNIGQAELGAEAGVGVATVQRLERGRSVASTSLIRVLRVLGLLEALDRAVPELLPSPIEQLRLRGRQRRRARRPRATGGMEEHPEPWRWGDEPAAER